MYKKGFVCQSSHGIAKPSGPALESSCCMRHFQMLMPCQCHIQVTFLSLTKHYAKAEIMLYIATSRINRSTECVRKKQEKNSVYDQTFSLLYEHILNLENMLDSSKLFTSHNDLRSMNQCHPL